MTDIIEVVIHIYTLEIKHKVNCQAYFITERIET